MLVIQGGRKRNWEYLKQQVRLKKDLLAACLDSPVDLAAIEGIHARFGPCTDEQCIADGHPICPYGIERYVIEEVSKHANHSRR